VKIIFDWSAGTADVEVNRDGASVYTYSDRPLINNTNIESIYFKGFGNTGDGWESGTGQEMWLDNFSVFQAIVYEVSGTVAEEGVYVERTVRLYKRSDGTLIDEDTSSYEDGTFYLTTESDEEHYVIALDDTSDATDYNALIYDRVTPIEVT